MLIRQLQRISWMLDYLPVLQIERLKKPQIRFGKYNLQFRRELAGIWVDVSSRILDYFKVPKIKRLKSPILNFANVPSQQKKQASKHWLAHVMYSLSPALQKSKTIYTALPFELMLSTLLLFSHIPSKHL